MNAIQKTTVSFLSYCALLPLLGCGNEPRLPLEPRPEFVIGGAAAWSVFGTAAAVRQEVPGDPWAVQLQSSGTGFGGVAFSPPTPLTLAEVAVLSADFNGDCGGGSPRFQLGMDTNNDGVRDGNIFVALGPSPNFTGCTPGWQNTGNLIGNNEHGRYDASQVGGSTFGTYAGAVAAAGGTARVLGIQLVVDAGWLFGQQTVLVDNVRVNEHSLPRGFIP